MKDHIEHIVYLMLENRSFDHILGWLYDEGESCNFIPEPRVGSKPASYQYNGLNTGNYSNADAKGNKTYASKIPKNNTQAIPDVDPNEPFEHVHHQLKNNMQGFITDFASETSNPEQIMQCYTPDSLPCINYLAKNYAVSDVYFSSIPTQTNCNRAFSLTGNSIGNYHYFDDDPVAMVDNYWMKRDGMPYEFTEKTVWNVLSDNGHDSPDTDWAVFYSQTWPGLSYDEGNYCFTQDLLWPSLKDKTDHFKDISKFFSLADSGNLPKFSYLEPTWYEIKDGFGHSGTDYHPPGKLHNSELFLWKIYTTLKKSPKWENTLFIINFDEHGGTYDHVEPPATVAPWDNPKDGTSKPELSPICLKYNFDFTELGVRVPLILVSPSIKPKTVFRPGGTAVFDHTSIIATILNYFEIPKEKWQLGSRTANAATFENLFRNIHVIEEDESYDEVCIPSPPEENVGEKEIEANHLHKMIGHRYLWRKMQQLNYPDEELHKLYKEHFANIKTMDDLNNVIKTILKIMSE